MPLPSSVSGERLTSDDHLFVLMEQVLGTPVIPQVIWDIRADGQQDRLDEILDHLTKVGRRLRTGRLSRRVHRTTGPQRDCWEFTPEAGRVHVSRDPVLYGSMPAWVDARWKTPIDSVHGPAWEFSATPTSAGNVIVSLVRSHVVADGAALIRAVTDAVRDIHLPPPEKIHRGDAVQDALSLASSSASAALSLIRRRSPSTTPPTSGVLPEEAIGPAVVPTVAVRIDAQHFAAVAATVGGTTNTLFQAVTLGVLVGSGRVTDGDIVPLSIPMAMRDAAFLQRGYEVADDLRANATTGAVAAVEVRKDRYSDLSPLRAASKQAYSVVQGRASQDSVSAMATVAQILPDAVVRRATESTKTPLCLASNLGEPDRDFTTLGLPDVHCDLALRSTIRVDSAHELAQLRGGLSAWAVHSGDTLSLSFTSLDPLAVHDAEDLVHLVREELQRWGFTWDKDVIQWL